MAILDEKRIKPIPTGSFVNGSDDRRKYDASSQIIRGTMSFSKDKLRELDQSYTGYTHIFVTKMPYFMSQLAKGKMLESNPELVKEAQYHFNNLKAMLELASTSYNGTPDLVLNTAEVNIGWAERSFAVPTTSAYDSTQFTIKCLETRSEPLRKGREWYINGITDAIGKYTDYYGATDDQGYLLEFLAENHTFEFMVVQTDSTLRNIQDISIWRNSFFTDVQRDQLNWDQGQIEVVQPQDVQFKGIYYPNGQRNQGIFNVAKKYLAKRYSLYKKIDDFTDKDFGLTHYG